MDQTVEAMYEHGLLRPVEPLDIGDGERVQLAMSTPVSAKAAARAPKQDRNSPHLAANSEPVLREVLKSYSIDDMIDHDFVAYARAHVAGLTRRPTLEEVREGLSSIKGSLSALIEAERGE